MVRLKNYFTKWVELSEVEKSFDGAVELMVREQFANACSQDLSVYLNEKSPKTLDELVILAEQYLMAHDKLSSKDVMARLGDTCRFGRGKSPESFRAVVRCYRCGGEGHQAVECVSIFSCSGCFYGHNERNMLGFSNFHHVMLKNLCFF